MKALIVVALASAFSAHGPDSPLPVNTGTPSPVPIPVRLTAVRIDTSDSSVQGHLDANGATLKHKADVYVAVALNHAQSQVLGGENHGRRLTHVAVVLKLVKVGRLEKAHNFDQDFRLELPAGADPQNLRLVAFVQEPGSGQVTGIVSEDKLVTQ